MEEINSQMKKLYVCDIAPTVTATTLEEKFSSFGNLSEADIRLDRKTKNPRFAFMTYENHSDAEKAFKEMNYAELDGMQIRIMWSKTGMYHAPDGQSNVLVKGLNEDVTGKSLHNSLDKFGTVFSCKVPLLNGKSKGYGYVNFTSVEEAQKALDQNGKEFADSDGTPLTKDGKLDISTFTSHDERVKKSKENKTGSFTNVFIKNFGDNLNDNTLISLFSDSGLISSACVMRNSNGTSKGFGFVDFVSHDDAVIAIEKFNGTCLPGTETVLYVGRAQKKTERREELDNKFSFKANLLPKPEIKTSLYIKHLHDEVDEELLRKTFAHFGKLSSVKIDIDQNTGKCNGVGYVSYVKPNDAALALRSMRTRSIKNKKIFVDYLQSRADRDVLLSASKFPSTTASYPSVNKQNRSFSTSRSEHTMPPEMLYRRAIYQQSPQYFSPLTYQQPIAHTVNTNSNYMPTPTPPHHHHHHQQQQQQMSRMLSNGLMMQGVPPTSHYLLR